MTFELLVSFELWVRGLVTNKQSNTHPLINTMTKNWLTNFFFILFQFSSLLFCIFFLWETFHIVHKKRRRIFIDEVFSELSQYYCMVRHIIIKLNWQIPRREFGEDMLKVERWNILSPSKNLKTILGTSGWKVSKLHFWQVFTHEVLPLFPTMVFSSHT